MMRLAPPFALALLALAVSSVGCGTAGPPTVAFDSFEVPSKDAQPGPIAAQPDGSVWFVETANPSGIFGHLRGGHISELGLRRQGLAPLALCVSADGTMWFAGVRSIGRIASDGTTRVFHLDQGAPPAGETDQSADRPETLVPGPDGAIWFTEPERHSIGRITSDGKLSTFAAPHRAAPYGITVGPDGALWFTDRLEEIGRLTTAGAFSFLPLPKASPIVGAAAGGRDPQQIVTGGDGALYFVEQGRHAIGRMTPSGDYREFTVNSPVLNESLSIAVAKDGTLWAAALGANELLRFHADGSADKYPLSMDNAEPIGLTPAADGSLWFSEPGLNQIGHATIQ